MTGEAASCSSPTHFSPKRTRPSLQLQLMFGSQGPIPTPQFKSAKVTTCLAALYGPHCAPQTATSNEDLCWESVTAGSCIAAESASNPCHTLGGQRRRIAQFCYSMQSFPKNKPAVLWYCKHVLYGSQSCFKTAAGRYLVKDLKATSFLEFQTWWSWIDFYLDPISQSRLDQIDSQCACTGGLHKQTQT